jgi:phage shock protein A
MSDLSDFIRRVYDPEIAALQEKLRRAERGQVALGEELVTWMKKANEAEARAQKAEAEWEAWQDKALAAEAVVEAARAYKEHTEDQHFRRGHFNTSCPPLTRAMCTEYMELRRALTAYDEPPTEQIPGTGQVGC